MNILDITPADIERLKENKIVFGLMDKRDRKILEFVDTGNTERYCASGFFKCREGGIFCGTALYRVVSGYTLPAPTEADIIAYLQASEVPPSQWHPAAQEWARRHEGERIWEFQTECGNKNFWIKTSYISDSVSIDTEHVHRLRADYGKANVLYGKMEDFPVPIPEPEVCVYNGVKDVVYTSPHDDDLVLTHKWIKCRPFCPVCGKRIEVKV